jgi:hypothetical protein
MDVPAASFERRRAVGFRDHIGPMGEHDFERVIAEGRALQERFPDTDWAHVRGACQHLGRTLIKHELANQLPASLSPEFFQGGITRIQTATRRVLRPCRTSIGFNAAAPRTGNAFTPSAAIRTWQLPSHACLFIAIQT